MVIFSLGQVIAALFIFMNDFELWFYPLVGHFSPFSNFAYCIIYNMTIPPWPEKREETCSSFLNSPFHVPTPGYSASLPCITTSNTSSQPNSHRLQPWGGDWLSHRAHLPSCFYYHSHLSLPPVAHLSSPGIQDASRHDRVFTVKGWRSTVSSYQRAFMYSQWLEWGYWCASRGHDLGGKSLWKGVISKLSSFPFWTGHLLTITSWLTACKSDALLKLHTVV